MFQIFFIITEPCLKASCDKILNSARESCLNFSLEETTNGNKENTKDDILTEVVSSNLSVLAILLAILLALEVPHLSVLLASDRSVGDGQLFPGLLIGCHA